MPTTGPAANPHCISVITQAALHPGTHRTWGKKTTLFINSTFPPFQEGNLGCFSSLFADSTLFSPFSGACLIFCPFASYGLQKMGLQPAHLLSLLRFRSKSLTASCSSSLDHRSLQNKTWYHLIHKISSSSLFFRLIYDHIIRQMFHANGWPSVQDSTLKLHCRTERCSLFPLQYPPQLLSSSSLG